MTYSDGTEGWSGSDTSRERAEHDRDTGTGTKRQRAVLAALDAVGPTGLTWKELGDLLHLHHGSASSSLTNLHRTGQIYRTSRKRLRSKVYVLPSNLIAGEPIEPYRPNRSAAKDQVRVLEDRVARARMALLTESGKSAALTILEEN